MEALHHHLLRHQHVVDLAPGRFGHLGVLIEHDLETVMNISERVIVMAEGKIIADGLPNS